MKMILAMFNNPERKPIKLNAELIILCLNDILKTKIQLLLKYYNKIVKWKNLTLKAVIN